MSSALAIASVTAVLREVLRDALVDHGVSTIVASADVTAVAPDRVAPGNSVPRGLNLYCYGVSPNPGWRNAELPSRNGDGARLTNPPLALDLHYLLTAYGAEDMHAEVLLGYAMHRLHEVPVLERATVRAILQDPGILAGRLADSDLADQVEQVKITPVEMSTEEISKLWAAFQSSYRPSAAYRASVVLITAEEPARTPLPVLTRGGRDTATGREEGVTVTPGLVLPYPTLTGVEPPNRQPVAQLGETLLLLGHHLDGTGHAVVFTHARFDVTHEVAPDAVSDDEVAVTVPGGVAAAADWPAGLYTVRLTLVRDGEDRATNSLPLALAPTMDVPGIVVSTVGVTTTLDVPVAPEVRTEQSASLVVGEREVVAEEHPAQTGMLSFEMEDAAPGTHLVRLRVDGVESVLVDRAVSPPEFDTSQQVTV